jgi:hypothetical protein
METFRCSGDRCTKPACCKYNGEKVLCYLHAACEKNGELAFFDFNSAKRQASELKEIATVVWEELVEELEVSTVKMTKTSALGKQTVVTLAAASFSAINSRPTSDVKSMGAGFKRSSVWDVEKQSGTTLSDGKSAEDLLSMPADLICPRCHKHGVVRYRCISSSIEAAKADTWGSSNRPDRVLQYSCGSCNKTWLVEEG